MKFRFIFFIVLLTLSSFNQTESFKEQQLKYSRVREAYKESESKVLQILNNNHIQNENLRIYLRAFKQDKIIELWAKNNTEKSYKLIKEFKICRRSGELGPKREQGDLQVPEGFYHINRFNPSSKFYLSLGINYPNKSDKILGVKGNLGGDIFIHGSCVTVGCMPITNDRIKELYVFCVEAKNSGQERIPITIFPTKLNDSNFNNLVESYKSEPEKTSLWKDLKKAYDLFNETKKLPNIGFLENGKHHVY